MTAPILRLKAKIARKARSTRQGFDGFWHSLTLAQRLYTVALMVYPVSVWMTMLLTVTALVIEFWPRFLTLFHSLPGKAILLLFYATITNFVLATAASTVNEVTGVDAQHFDYTHNFAILLFLPSWMLLLSVIALLLLQLVLPLYVLFLLLFKPFQRFGITLMDNTKRPILTALARFILCFITTLNLFVASGDFDNAGDAMAQLNDSFERGMQPQESTEEEASRKQKQFEVTVGAQNDSSDKLIKVLIAQFAYHLEADNYSRCAKSDNSKVVELNDYEIVELFEDESAPYGIRFEVKKCISAAFPQ
ncbi:hypothetical protein V1358_10825 [Pseudoalteromonas sp. YIC-656]|uniref:hypothetical protein n=1 Tax=Pseudoalteromonas pernae TaxID=3118054 RepID=UPI0032420F70